MVQVQHLQLEEVSKRIAGDALDLSLRKVKNLQPRQRTKKAMKLLVGNILEVVVTKVQSP